MADDPDLTAELDAAEEIVMGRAADVVTEWGCRLIADDVLNCGDGGENFARQTVRSCQGRRVLVRRTVTYGPWEEVPDA